MNATPDAIVVGAGVVGAACAYYLTGEGFRVVVVDGSFAGGGATSAAMGHVVVMDDSPEQLGLTHYAQRLWESVWPEPPAAFEHDPCGTLWIAEDEEQLQALPDKRARYAAHGIAAEILDAAALAECEPNLRAPLAGALRVPGDSVVYPPAVALWLLERAQERGATLREGFRVDAIRGEVVESGAERLTAGLVINAAGAEASRLTPGLPVRPRKGHLAITDRYPGFCRHQLVELGYLKGAHGLTPESVAFNVQPRATGQLLVGSSRELVGWDRAVNQRVLQAMLRRAVRFMPRLAELSALRVWTGFRPATPDHLPLIGGWDENESLWIAAGHEGLGITLSLATGAIVTDLILGRTPAIDPAPLSPRRVGAGAGERLWAMS